MKSYEHLFVAVAASLVGAFQACAEPSVHYANRPAVLPAAMEYGVPYQAETTTIRYAQPPKHTSYQRTYSATEDAHGTLSIERPYRGKCDCGCGTSRRVLQISTAAHFGRRTYGYPVYRPVCRPLFPRYGYGLHRFYHGGGHGRYWGFGVGYGRDRCGSHGGFSFHYGH